MPVSDSTTSTSAPVRVEMDTFHPCVSVPAEQSRSCSRVKSMPSKDPPKQLKKREYTIGICLLLVVVLLWTSSNFITQDLFEGGYEKPFLLTYLNTSSFALYLLPFWLRRVLDRRREVKNGPNSEEVRRRRSGDEYQPLVNNSDSQEEPPHPDGHQQVSHNLPPLTVRETAKLAFTFCFFWFIANWSVNASLDYTSVASATILSSLSGFFTLIIGRLFQVEILTIGKIGAVVTSFAGSLLVASSDSNTNQPSNATSPLNNLSDALADGNGSRPLLGDFLALISALFYALYVILLKVRIREESRVNMQLFFGFVGLFNILCCWPIGFFLHFAGVERFEMPTTRQAVFGILVNMAITLTSDFIYVLAMLKTTPLVVTIGLSLTIPLAILGDFFLGRPTHSQALFGATLVLISFIAIGVQSSSTKADDDLLNHSLQEPPHDELTLQG